MGSHYQLLQECKPLLEKVDYSQWTDVDKRLSNELLMTLLSQIKQYEIQLEMQNDKLDTLDSSMTFWMKHCERIEEHNSTLMNTNKILQTEIRLTKQNNLQLRLDNDNYKCEAQILRASIESFEARLLLLTNELEATKEKLKKDKYKKERKRVTFHPDLVLDSRKYGMQAAQNVEYTKEQNGMVISGNFKCCYCESRLDAEHNVCNYHGNQLHVPATTATTEPTAYTLKPSKVSIEIQTYNSVRELSKSNVDTTAMNVFEFENNKNNECMDYEMASTSAACRAKYMETIAVEHNINNPMHTLTVGDNKNYKTEQFNMNDMRNVQNIMERNKFEYNNDCSSSFNLTDVASDKYKNTVVQPNFIDVKQSYNAETAFADVEDVDPFDINVLNESTMSCFKERPKKVEAVEPIAANNIVNLMQHVKASNDKASELEQLKSTIKKDNFVETNERYEAVANANNADKFNSSKPSNNVAKSKKNTKKKQYLEARTDAIARANKKSAKASNAFAVRTNDMVRKPVAEKALNLFATLTHCDNLAAINDVEANTTNDTVKLVSKQQRIKKARNTTANAVDSVVAEHGAAASSTADTATATTAAVNSAPTSIHLEQCLTEKFSSNDNITSATKVTPMEDINLQNIGAALLNCKPQRESQHNINKASNNADTSEQHTTAAAQENNAVAKLQPTTVAAVESTRRTVVRFPILINSNEVVVEDTSKPHVTPIEPGTRLCYSSVVAGHFDGPLQFQSSVSSFASTALLSDSTSALNLVDNTGSDFKTSLTDSSVDLSKVIKKKKRMKPFAPIRKLLNAQEDVKPKSTAADNNANSKLKNKKNIKIIQNNNKTNTVVADSKQLTTTEQQQTADEIFMSAGKRRYEEKKKKKLAKLEAVKLVLPATIAMKQ